MASLRIGGRGLRRVGLRFGLECGRIALEGQRNRLLHNRFVGGGVVAPIATASVTICAISKTFTI